MIQKLQQDFFHLQIEAYDLVQNGLMLVWIICIVVFSVSWFASGRPSWMALVGFIVAFAISMELKQCQPVPHSGAGVSQVPSGPRKSAPSAGTPSHSPSPPISPRPIFATQPSPPSGTPPPVLPIMTPPPPSPVPTQSPIPVPISPTPTPLQRTSPELRNLPIAVIVGATSPRFEAVLVKKEGKKCKLRLFDTKTGDWLDDKIHVVKHEPQLGQILELDGVSAKYVGMIKVAK